MSGRTVVDSAQRAHMLWLLRLVLDPQDDRERVEVSDALGDVVGADIGDFLSYMRGYATASSQSEQYVRELELRCMPYKDYLQSPEWGVKRDAQLLEDGFRCRVCNSPDGLQVHHRTYEHRGHEQPGDLVTLCAACHGDFHSNRQLVKAR